MATEIKFGTDGWRGIIADDYTYENVRRVAKAIASYVLKNEDHERGVVVGYDTRFGSRRFAELTADTIANAGINVVLANDHTPTPAISYAVKNLGAAGGVVITSSHNPWNWNGVKFKAKYGGSATPGIIKLIEAELDRPMEGSRGAGKVHETDLKEPYVNALLKFADIDMIGKAGFKFAIDSMYGAGRGMLAKIFNQRGIEHLEIRGELNPLFPGINPEPIEPHVKMLQETVVREKCHAGFATDGDADRLGAVAGDGSFVDSHKIFSIILRWLLERKKWPGEIVKAFNTTKMLDRIAKKHGRKLHETGIGFKFICDLMLERDILIGGEESGGIGITRHLPERDGILNSLLLANIMAEEGKTLAQLVADLQKEYGEHHYARRDMHIANEVKNAAMAKANAGQITRLGRHQVTRTEKLDGVKFYIEAPTTSSASAASASAAPAFRSAAAGATNAVATAGGGHGAATSTVTGGGRSMDVVADKKKRGEEDEVAPPAEAWLLMRASGTEPLLRLYAEAGSPALVNELLAGAVDIVEG